MSMRRGIGAVIGGLLLVVPLVAFGQGQQPRDPNTLKTHVAPSATAPAMPPALIIPRDRTVIQNYYRGQAKAGHCPPGQAKKNNGGCPPGEARPMGPPPARADANMAIQPLPRPLLERLTVAPNGYAYGYSNGSVVLYSTSGRRTIADSAPAW